jgi:Raf kinase inhibitor-like YbhB/YbcL family protein
LIARFRATRAHWLVFLLSTGAACGFASWRAAVARASPDASLTLTSSSFRANGEIPARFTCQSADLSPQLSWSDPPAGTRSFALIMNDPDAPDGDFIHWVIYDLPSSTRSLSEGVVQSPEAAGGRQGTNSFGKIGYSGPCPPPGRTHRYFIRIWALDSSLNLQDPDAAALESAMRGHILARGEIMGRFRR